MGDRRPSESDIPMHGWAPYSDLHRERIRAHAKWAAAGESTEQMPYTDPLWLPIVVEEIGEVSRALNEHEGRDRLREELVQVGAMVAAWIDAIDAAPRGTRDIVQARHGGEQPFA